MRKTTILLFLSFYCIVHAEAQWRSIHRGDDKLNTFLNASFYSRSEGFVLSSNWVGFTVDSGRTFQKKFITDNNVDYGSNPVNLTFGFYHSDIKAFGNNRLLVAGEYGDEPSILLSTNNGNSWKVVFHKPFSFAGSLENYFSRMEFPANNEIGFAVFSDGIVRTTNGGNTWTEVFSTRGNELSYLDFVNNQVGYVAGPDILLKTVDGGVSWTFQRYFPFSIKAISAVSSNLIYALSTNDDIYYSTNAGVSWTRVNAPIARLSTDNIYFVNDSVGYSAAGYVYQTRNRGKSWERLPSDRDPEVGQLVPFSSDVMWACGEGERLALTSNRGGVAHPLAYFDFDVSTICTSDGVLQLQNESNRNYKFQWYRNNRLLANTYQTSFIVGNNISDTIKLVISDGFQRDSMVRVLDYTGYSLIKLQSVSLQDTLCGRNYAQFLILNSQPGVTYSVGRLCCGYSAGDAGTGKDLIIKGYSGGNEDSTSTFFVFATIQNNCGNQLVSQAHKIHLFNSTPGIEVVDHDTVCLQKLFYIRVRSTQKRYEYWADSGLPKVKGNGGTILVPARLTHLTQLRRAFVGSLFEELSFQVFVQHERFSCGVAESHVIHLYARRPDAQFEPLGAETFTGDTLRFLNLSEKASSYYWRFGRGAVYKRNDTQEPQGLRFTRPGIRQVTLYAYSKEGCVDSLSRSIEVFNQLGEVGTGEICPTTKSQNHVDSIYNTFHYDSHAISEDRYGSRVIAGTIRLPGRLFRYLVEPSGWFAKKYAKDGRLLWQLENGPYDASEQYAIEQVQCDQDENTYLLGYGYSGFGFHSPFYPRLDYIRPGQGAFIIKVSPKGEILWIRFFYNQNGNNFKSPNWCRGTLLMGQNDELYYVTQRRAGETLMMDQTMLVDDQNPAEGLILRLNGAGQVMQQRSFPSSYKSFEQYAIYLPGQPDYKFNLTAQWAPDGQMVLYNEMPPQTRSAELDGIALPANLSQINQGLLFLDTSALKFTKIRPVYKWIGESQTKVYPDAYTIDEAGNYYLTYTQLNYYHNIKPIYDGDTLKPKTYLMAFTPEGDTRWIRKIEGLQAGTIIATKDQLKLGGLNYYLYNGAFFINHSGHSPAREGAPKMTIVGDTSNFAGKGRAGLGSIDVVVASFNAHNGALLDLTQLGSPLMDASMAMTKGHGPHLWVASTVGSHYTNGLLDTFSVMKTFKLPLNDEACNLIYPTPGSYLSKTAKSQELNYTKGRLNVFPNPFSHEFSIYSDSPGNNIQSVLIRDGIGRVVWQNSNINTPYLQVNGANLSKGQWYFIAVQTRSGLLNTKIIKH